MRVNRLENYHREDNRFRANRSGVGSCRRRG